MRARATEVPWANVILECSGLGAWELELPRVNGTLECSGLLGVLPR